MAELRDDDGALVATDTFSMDCPDCGPATVHFLDGEMVPHSCGYVPPSVAIDCTGGPDGV